LAYTQKLHKDDIQTTCSRTEFLNQTLKRSTLPQ